MLIFLSPESAKLRLSLHFEQQQQQHQQHQQQLNNSVHNPFIQQLTLIIEKKRHLYGDFDPI